MMGRARLLLSLLCSSCVSTTSNVCENGSVCPGGFVCDIEFDRCLLPEQIAVCNGMTDGDACAFNGNITGSCLGGACEPFRCGDGIVTGVEECDGDNLDGLDCKSFGYYGTEGLACSSSCTFRKEGCKIHQYCGDNIVNGPELCDGPEQRSCVSLGFDAGAAGCTNSCTFTINDCSRFGWNPESLSDVIALAVTGSSRTDQWAVGTNGRAMHYEGVYWTTVPTTVQNELVRAWANSASDVWAVGQSRSSGPALASVVIHWDGTAWSTVGGIPSAEYIDVWGTGPSAMFVATSSGSAIYKYDGTAWTPLPPFDGQPIAINGTSGSDIWVPTNGGPLMHFNGATWTDLTPSGASIRFIDANAPDDVWAIGYESANLGNGVAAHWDGSAWTQHVFAQQTLNVIASSAANDAWIGGVDGVMRHWDGTAWSRSTNIGASPSGLTALSGLVSFGAGEVVGVSTLNLAYRYRGQAFGVLAALGSNPFDTADNTAIWTASTALSFVTNVQGEVWKYDGTTWTLVYTVPSGPTGANDVTGTSASDVWVVDDAGSAHHFNGTSWAAEQVVNGLPLDHVWTDGTDVWAFGASGAYKKGSSSWTHYTLDGHPVLGVSGTRSDLWAVADGGGAPNTLWHWDGATWSVITTNASTNMLAVLALAPDDVHVSAQKGRMLHFNGSAWTESVVPVLADIVELAATASDDVIGVSARDAIHYDGTQWSTLRTPVDFEPNSTDYLPIVDVSATPGRIDILEVRYRIRTLIRTRPLVCRQRETCGDAVDNDCDGLVDDADSQECP